MQSLDIKRIFAKQNCQVCGKTVKTVQDRHGLTHPGLKSFGRSLQSHTVHDPIF